TTATVLGLFHFGLKAAQLRPGRIQMTTEFLFSFVRNTLESSVGKEGLAHFPLIFSIFLFVLFGNLFGMIPGGFTFTSHIVVTFALALFIFIIITGIAISQQGFGFFKRFLPEGVPWPIIPIIIPVEILSYVFRPVSLSIRLFANMLAGHIILKIFAGFTIMMGFFGFLPLALNVVFIGFEFFVAALQAYIFTILSCAYLNDALQSH
ncbi:MAG: F0F1 ATP synthase subunit A, partial [bacterium]|nr:F0F1 ATP synthase subunit A [bacterium]